MNKLVVSLLLTTGVAGAATAAQPVKGDAAAGRAKTAVCGACHNPDGNSLAPNFPKLAGQGQRYLEKQLHDIKSGKRTVLEMTGMLAAFSDQTWPISPPTSPARKAAWARPIPSWSNVAGRCSTAATWKRHACLHRLPLAERRGHRLGRLPALAGSTRST